MEFVLTSPLSTPDECGICYSSADSWTNLPCSHRLCQSCFVNLRASTCPWCRSFIPSSITECVQSLIITEPRINRIPETPRLRSLSEGEITPSRNDLHTPQQVINYERIASRKTQTRARIREKRIRDSFGKERRDILSRQRDPVAHARNQALEKRH